MDQDCELRQTRQERRALEQTINAALAAKSVERSALEGEKKRLTDKLSLMQGWVDRHHQKIEQASKEINTHKVVLREAKADRIRLSRSLEDAVGRLKRAEIEQKQLSRSYKELQLQCNMYRDEVTEVRKQYEAELGSDYLRETEESRQAAENAIQLRSVAQNKVTTLTTQLQLAASRHTDSTARLQQASELIAHLRLECATQTKARDELKQEAKAKRISLTTISRASAAKKSSLKGSSKPKKGRKVAFTLPPSTSSRAVFIDKENVGYYQVCHNTSWRVVQLIFTIFRSCIPCARSRGKQPGGPLGRQ
jgi:chromosome segregation ATPase